MAAVSHGNPSPQFLQAGVPDASPWLGDIDIDDFGGDLVVAVASFDADAGFTLTPASR